MTTFRIVEDSDDDFSAMSAANDQVLSKHALNSIQKTAFGTLLENSNGFLWFRVASDAFEKYKDQILVIFYGKLMVEKLNIDDVKIAVKSSDSVSSVYVISEHDCEYVMV